MSSAIRKNFKQIDLYTILIQGRSTIFIDQMATNLVCNKVHFMMASDCSSVYHVVWKSFKMTGKIYSSLKKEPKYTLLIFCKMVYDTVLWNVCSILHGKNCVYLCNHEFFPIQLSLWHLWIHKKYVCMYVCM